MRVCVFEVVGKRAAAAMLVCVQVIRGCPAAQPGWMVNGTPKHTNPVANAVTGETARLASQTMTWQLGWQGCMWPRGSCAPQTVL